MIVREKKLKIRSLLSLVFVCMVLAGCTAVWSIQDASPGFRERKLSRPAAILPGQRAFVFGNGYYVDALRETGLFTSVEGTTSRQPSATGVYISFEDGDRYESSNANSGAMGTMMNVATLGVIPDPSVRAYNATYYISVYQNGSPLLNRNSVEMVQHVMAGWYALAVDEKESWRGEAKLLVERMIDGLNRVK